MNNFSKNCNWNEKGAFILSFVFQKNKAPNYWPTVDPDEVNIVKIDCIYNPLTQNFTFLIYLN